MARAWLLPALSLVLCTPFAAPPAVAAPVAPAPHSLRAILLRGSEPAALRAGHAPRQAAAVGDTAQFNDATTAALADTAASYGVTWGDYDADGDPDLCVANEYAASHLFHNDAGVLDDAAGPWSELENSDAMTWADYDNDGDADLCVAQYGQPSHLYRNDGGDVFTDVSAGPFLEAHATTSAVWGDFDRDGRLDLYLTDFWGANRLLRNLGGDAFADVTPPVLAGHGSSMSASWGDADGDGDLDLYVANFSHANQLFRNDGHGAFTDVSTAVLAAPGWSTGAVWADLDGDADLDLFVVSDGDASHVLRNDGALVFTDVTPASVAVPGAGIGAACADIDLDGDLDVYVTRYGEKNQMFRNDGAGGFDDVAGLMLADSLFSTGAAFGDADRDGDPDLFMADDGDANRLYRNDQSTGNHWLQVRLHGTHSNRSAIGARVRIVSGGVSQVRELSGGSGFGSQDELLASFGLGANATVDSMVVNWPSGIVEVVSPLAGVDQLLELTETSAPLAVGPPSAVAAGVKLAAPSPNPFRSGTRLAYELPRAARVRLSVHDAQGRQVATLADDAEAPGVHQVSWDGRDAAGHDAPAGFYLVRLTTAAEAGRATQVVKLLLTR